MTSKYNIILGSGSPEESKFIFLGLSFNIQIPNIDESSDLSTPEQICEDISFKKFKDIQRIVNDEKAIIITGIFVCYDNKVFENEKPRRRLLTLELLSGKEQFVISSLYRF